MAKAGLSLLLLSCSLLCDRTAQAAGAEQQIVQLERQLTEALSHSDTRSIDALWADDLVWIGLDGRTSSKAQQLATMRSAMGTGALTATNKRVDVRIYGSTALVTVISAWTSATAGNAGSPTDYVATHVWTRTAGRWRLVTAHISKSAR